MLTKSIRLFRQFRFCTSVEEIAKKQAEWNAIAQKKSDEQLKYLQSSLSNDQKIKVKAIADACCELDLFELQCLMSLMNEKHLKSQGIGLCEINSNWPSSIASETPTWPPQTKDQVEAYLKDLFGENSPDFKSVFGGVGTASMAGQAQQAPKAEEKVEAKEEAPKAEAEKKNYDVELAAIDAAQKIKIIKEVRQMLNLGLKEAKDLVEKLPANLGKQVPKERANELKEKLTAAGCTINLK